jgi:hypothetical protein
MKWFTRSVAVCVVALASGCSSPPVAETPEQVSYMSRVESAPLQLTVSTADLDAAIDRTVDWLVEYHHLGVTEADRSAFKELTRANDAGVISSPMTYRVQDVGSHGYTVTFAILGDSVKVEVLHAHEGGFALGKAVARNAHILAHYIKTGELMPELVGP